MLLKGWYNGDILISCTLFRNKRERRSKIYGFYNTNGYTKKELNNQPYSLLKGRLGVSWGIQYLANKNILELDDEVMKFRSIGMQDCMSYGFWHLYQ